MHPCFENVQLRFAHRSLESQKQTIVMVGWIVQTVGIGEQDTIDRAQLQQRMPVFARASETTHLQAQHDTHTIGADLGKQSLKAFASYD